MVKSQGKILYLFGRGPPGERKSNHFEIYTGKNHPFCDMSETQAGIKIAGRNINNLRYADDTTLMADSEEELKSLLMKVKEEN